MKILINDHIRTTTIMTTMIMTLIRILAIVMAIVIRRKIKKNCNRKRMKTKKLYAWRVLFVPTHGHKGEDTLLPLLPPPPPSSHMYQFASDEKQDTGQPLHDVDAARDLTQLGVCTSEKEIKS